MAKSETKSVAQLLHETAMASLNAYRANPWEWLRESDLVADLVARLKDGLTPSTTHFEIDAGDLPGCLVSGTGGVSRQISRVRTEAKLFVDHGDARGGKATSPRTKVDIAILEAHAVKLRFAGNGARDVVLATRDQDVAGVLEVKLYPDLYLNPKISYWADDILKLEGLAGGKPRGVLLVDTSLPLAATALTYTTKKVAGRLGEKRQQAARWPLLAGKEFEIKRGGRELFFSPCDDPQPGRVHLWALGIVPAAAWDPVFVRSELAGAGAPAVVPHVAHEAAIAACWSVDM